MLNTKRESNFKNMPAAGIKNKNGKWGKVQNDRFFKALTKYGKDWAMIQKFVRTRSLAQVRSHAQKLFQIMPKKDLEELEKQINNRHTFFCSKPCISNKSFHLKKEKENIEQQEHFKIEAELSSQEEIESKNDNKNLKSEPENNYQKQIQQENNSPHLGYQHVEPHGYNYACNNLIDINPQTGQPMMYYQWVPNFYFFPNA